MENSDRRYREALRRVGDSEEKPLDEAGDGGVDMSIVIEYQILLCVFVEFALQLENNLFSMSSIPAIFSENRGVSSEVPTVDNV